MNCSEIITINNNIPKRGTENSAGYDFTYKGEEIIIKQGETKLINLKVKIALPSGTVLFLKTRSSFAKIGINVTGGVIDSDYRGDIMVCILNCSDKEFKIDDGMKICQGVLLKYETILFVPVNKFSEETERGENGFGSTDRVKHNE